MGVQGLMMAHSRDNPMDIEAGVPSHGFADFMVDYIE